MEYFFLGETELVIAFRFIGIDGMAVNNSSEAITAFKKITENDTTDVILPAAQSEAVKFPTADNCHILIMTEEVAAWLGDLLVDWQLSGRYPLLVEIPGIAGKMSGRKTLVDTIREAIGIHV
ncbi:MAG: ATPase V [Treponema sp.]|nr:ATPase V [Treponema sp.]